MGAGSVIHATETRQMDRLGGLGKSMPATLILFTIGAVAICGLPPLNGFFSELLIYLGLFGTATDQATGPQWSWIVLAAPALAMIGAMAVVTFVKLVGFVFLGNLRNDYPHAHDPTTSMRMPMMILAAICIIIGVAPALLMETLRRGVMVWSPSVGTFANMLTENVPPLRYSGIALALLALTTAIVWIAFKRRAAGTVRPGITWDCGYVRPTARMEYTGTSFAQMPVELLAWILLPIKRLPSIPKLFSPASRFQYDVPDTLMDRGLMPALGRIERSMWRTRFIQGGSIQLYLLYIMGVLLLLLFLR